MNQKLEEFLPENENNEFTILVKNKSIGSLNYMGANFDIIGQFSNVYEELKKLEENNNGEQSYYIVKSNFALKLHSDNDVFSHDEIAQIVNKTQEIIGVDSEVLLTESQIQERIKEAELEKAKSLGLVKSSEDILKVYLPKKDSDEFVLIAKNNAIDDLNQMNIVDSNPTDLQSSIKLLSILNKQKNDNWQYFIVTPTLAENLSTLSPALLGEAINQTQQILGLDSKLEIKKENKSAKPIVNEVEEQDNDILQSLDATKEDIQKNIEPETIVPASPPSPSTVKNGYNFGPIGQHLEMFKEQQKSNTKPLTKKKKILYIVGGTLGFIILPAVILLPACAILGYKALKKAKNDPANIWGKRQDLLKDAALAVNNIDDPAQMKEFKSNVKINDIIFTPEIASKYQELHEKMYKQLKPLDNGLNERINKAISSFRQNHNTDTQNITKFQPK